MTDTLPEGWTRRALDDLLEAGGIFDGPFGSNLKTDDYTDRGVRVIRLENIANLKFIADKHVYISEDKYRRLTKHTVSNGDIIVGSFVDGAVRVCVLPPLPTKAIAKADCFCVRTRCDVADRRFIAFQLGTEQTRDALLENIHGATRPRITTRQLRSVHLALPPLAEQHRIVQKIEELFARAGAASEHLAKVPAILRRFRQSVLAAACSGRLSEEWRQNHEVESASVELRPETPIADLAHIESLPELPDVPDGWVITSVGRVTASIKYGSNAKAHATSDSGVPILRMGNVQDGKIDVESLKYVPRSMELAEFAVQRGDLLFNRTNSPELVGKAAVFDRDEEMVFASYLIRVRANSDVILPEYLCAWIISPWGRSWARAVRTDGVSQSNINASKLADMPVPLPPLREQHQIAQRINALMTLLDRIEMRLKRESEGAEKLTQAILAKAFSGDLVPTEAELARSEGREYESAHELLQRVAGESSLRGTQGKRRRRPSQSAALD